ncbi:hypothetical protein RchiOBHm_Chr2g0138841 [Rosa chinensis]|uniref:Uncharacterized protein n=1 Tax=Rosa chinensis TaxID=74649 RepID=A0A2P6RWZ3_ROSCH|nr:hypothetical protein RchiOBHm_Chr2g0138841 [Rosa chinensis]
MTSYSGLLEGIGHPFTRNFQFIDSVKAYLSYALLLASVSPSPIILQYATGVFFLVLLLRFRESLKVCKDLQMLVDIFVNYDYDLEAQNLFEQMNISRDAKCRSNMAAASQTTSIKGSSLQCLVNVLKSLVDWEKSCGESDRIKTLSLWKEIPQLKSMLM